MPNRRDPGSHHYSGARGLRGLRTFSPPAPTQGALKPIVSLHPSTVPNKSSAWMLWDQDRDWDRDWDWDRRCILCLCSA